MPPENLYPTKTLKYNICKFFRDRRIKKPGIRNPFNIRLKDDLKYLLEYAMADNDRDKIESLRYELAELQGESLENGLSVIDISDLPNQERFYDSFMNNESLVVRCSSENIGEYILELETLTQAARRHFGLVDITPLSNGGVLIVMGDRQMIVSKNKDNHSINIRSNIIQLMYGNSILMSDENISFVDYEKGDNVLLNDLLSLLRKIEGGEEGMTNIDRRSITDAIRSLNKRANIKFGHPIIKNTVDDGLEWSL